MSQQIDEARVNALVNRVDSLERENRRIRRLGKGLLAGSALLALASAATPYFCKTVWAERLVLRNSSGKDVMTMDAYSSRTPSITMRDDQGKSVVRLSWEGGVLMDFLDEQGGTATSVKVDSEGQTTVARRNEDGDLVSMAD